MSLADRQDLSAELRGPTVAVGRGGNVGHGRVRPDGSLQQHLRAVGHGVAAAANLQRQIQQQGMQRTGGSRQRQLLEGGPADGDQASNASPAEQAKRRNRCSVLTVSGWNVWVVTPAQGFIAG